MALSDALASFLATSPSTYQALNPETTPEDYARLRDAIRQLPETPKGLVRLSDQMPLKRQTVNGAVFFNEDGTPKPDIWIYRQGDSYRSKDPVRLAGTIWHENAHITHGPDEIQARQRQLEFLRSQPHSDRRHVAELERVLKLQLERQILMDRLSRKEE